jgi:hypothetical protein
VNARRVRSEILELLSRADVVEMRRRVEDIKKPS